MAVIHDPNAEARPIARQQEGAVVAPQVHLASPMGVALEKFGVNLQEGAEEIRRAQVIEQEKADTTRVEDAWNQYKSAALGVTMGDDGVLRKRGGDAVNGDLMNTATRQLDDQKRMIGSLLTNDEQRARFATRVEATNLSVAHQILGHLDTENREYAKTTMAGSESLAQQQIAAAPQSLDVFVQARAGVMAQADVYLDHQGLTRPEDKGARDAFKDKISDGLWTKRIDTLLYSQPMLADALFRAHEKEIKNPELRLQLQARTREAAMGVSATIEAERVVTEVRSKIPPAGLEPETQPTSGAPISDTGVQPRSARNNNPGNIQKSGVKWEGEVQGNDPRFVTFATYEDGLRAMQKNLLAYQEKRGLNTVEGIIGRWAPAAENTQQSTDAYVKAVAGALGVAPGDKIDLKDPAVMQKMTEAMTGFEAGGTAAGLRRTSTGPAAYPSTNGLPSSRDVAAQLPYMLLRVEKKATELYGADEGNPDRAAFVKKMTSEIHSKVAADVQQLNSIQRQAQGVLIDAVTGVTAQQPQQGAGGTLQTSGRAGGGGTLITSFNQIQNDPKLFQQWQLLDPQAKLGIERLIEHNMRANDQGDNALYRQTWNRIHLEPGDPQKIDFYKQITDPRIADRLSIQQIGQLRLELDRAETPGGRSLTQMRRGADANVAQWFKTNIMFTAQPERQIAATMRWNEEVGKKVDAYVAAGTPEKVRSMFQLDTPESVVSPKYLQTFVDSTPAQGVAQQAQDVRAGAQAPAPTAIPAAITTREQRDAWFKTLPPEVTTFQGADGRVYKVPGRQPGAAAPAAAPDVSDLRTGMPDMTGPDGKRADGSAKGTGFLGPLKAAGGKVSSEVSIGVQIDGKETEIPSLVPTLTRAEVDQVLAGEMPKSVVEKATAFAKERIKAGKPVFAQPGEGPQSAAPQQMTETGKIVTPPAAVPPVAGSAEPQMPTLVARQSIKDRHDATRAAEAIRQADQNVRTAEGAVSAVKAAGAGVVDRAKDIASAAQAPYKAAVAGVRAAVEAVPSDAEKAAYAFRGILKQGQYSPQSAGTIQEAIDSGMLTPAELRIAKAMLGKLGGR